MFSSLNSSLLFRSTFVRSLTVIGCAVLAIPSFGDEPSLKSPVNFSIATIYSDGNNILMSRPTPGEGNTVQQTYTVMIPVTVNGVTTMRAETRTRTVNSMKLALLPVLEGTYFQNVAGKKLETKDVAIDIPKAGRPVILITDPNLNEIPAEWRLLFNEKAVIMRTRFE